MRFKVGDKVKIKSDLEDRHGIPSEVIQENIHKILEIVKCYDDINPSYLIKEDNKRWFWFEDMLEPVEEIVSKINLNSDEIAIRPSSNVYFEPSPHLFMRSDNCPYYEPFTNKTVELQLDNCTLNKESFERIFGIDLETDKEKENIDMDIIDIYFDRKRRKIEKEYNEKIKEIKENDEIQVIINEMNNQLRAVFEEEGRENEFELYEVERTCCTRSTEKHIGKANEEMDKKIEKIEEDREVVKAAFELAETFEEKVKVLKTYKIYDKSGKMIED